MKETPLLFSAAMVRALLDGRKTMTRRVIKPQPLDRDGDGNVLRWNKGNSFGSRIGLARDCPYGQPGDRLWVRETVMFQLCDKKKEKVLHYRAGGHEAMDSEVWTPSILMPRWASRITLEVTGVRVERLREISERDAFAEGCEPKPAKEHDIFKFTNGFQVLWDSLNGKRDGGIYAWDKSPWVWVITFRKL